MQTLFKLMSLLGNEPVPTVCLFRIANHSNMVKIKFIDSNPFYFVIKKINSLIKQILKTRQVFLGFPKSSTTI